jgi:hypothetical protein
VRFWTSVLGGGRGGPISVRAGDQTLEIATVPALIQQSYGISDDQRDLMRLLDEEAPLITAEEEELVDIALSNEALDDAAHGIAFRLRGGEIIAGLEDDGLKSALSARIQRTGS